VNSKIPMITQELAPETTVPGPSACQGVCVPALHIVGADGHRYPTPDIPTIDTHLTSLAAQLRPNQPIAPVRRRNIQATVDRLLEARSLLQQLQDA